MVSLGTSLRLLCSLAGVCVRGCHTGCAPTCSHAVREGAAVYLGGPVVLPFSCCLYSAYQHPWLPAVTAVTVETRLSLHTGVTSLLVI